MTQFLLLDRFMAQSNFMIWASSILGMLEMMNLISKLF